MASGMQEMRRLHPCGAASAGTTVPVILDRGDGARVAAIELRCGPHLGMRFEYDGMVWELTHAQDHLRGWVAQPATGASHAMS